MKLTDLFLPLQELSWRSGERFHWLESDILSADGSPSGLKVSRDLRGVAQQAAESMMWGEYRSGEHCVVFRRKLETRETWFGRRVHMWLQFTSPADEQVFQALRSASVAQP